MYDDLKNLSWQSYSDDLQNTFRDCVLIPYSVLAGINKVRVGWWRQQLIKLYLDEILDDDEWLVVDGDVIFDNLIDPYTIPVFHFNSDHTTVMMGNYVKGLLGIDMPFLEYQNHLATTSSIPWRSLDRELLKQLRRRVSEKHPGDFLENHIKWFLDQTIVGGWPEPSRWVMSEWELIENFRYKIAGTQRPLKFTPSYDYHIDVEMLEEPTFRHGFVKDPEFDPVWFQTQNIDTGSHWHKSQRWWQDYQIK